MGLFFMGGPAFDPAKDLSDLTGKVVIVTGGNSGIGFATVQLLARHGAKVYIGARNEERAKTAIERLRTDGLQPGNGELEWLPLDLSDPHEAKKSAEDFLAKERRLDVLVHNAAVMNEKFVLNSFGVTNSLTVNHISPVVFTRTLLPLLAQTAKEPNSDVRIIMVSTAAIRILKGRDVRYRNVNDINESFSNIPVLNPFYRYAKHKMAALLYAKELQRKLDAEGTPITIVALHPGSVHSEGVKNDRSLRMPVIGPAVQFLLSKFMVTPTVGAYCPAFAAASPSVKAERDKYKGAFLWPPGKLGDPPAPQTDSKELAEEVWNITETLLKQWGL